MQINYQQLANQLEQKLASVYLLHGDEPLLLQFARDKIRDKAKQSGFTQYELLFVEPGFQWQQFTAITQNFSLFAGKTLVDVRLPSAKLDRDAIDCLLNYLTQPSADIVVLLSLPKLTTAQQKNKWYKAIEAAGMCVTIYNIKPTELPGWLQQLCRQQQLKIDAPSIKLLAELSAGNLLAAHQAVEKLKLRFPEQVITTDKVTAIVSDNARFTIFDLTNQLLANDIPSSLRITNALRNESTEITLALWAITRELRLLISYANQLQQGATMHTVLNREWATRKPLLQHTLKRLNYQQLLSLLDKACNIDAIIKGIQPGNAWRELEQLIIAFKEHNCHVN